MVCQALFVYGTSTASSRFMVQGDSADGADTRVEDGLRNVLSLSVLFYCFFHFLCLSWRMDCAISSQFIDVTCDSFASSSVVCVTFELA